MRFRCPNCNVPVDVAAEETTGGNTLSEVTCPSCQSRFSISGQDAPTEIPLQGLQIARFEAREVLGEGAFGTVYRAWDPQLERFVAVKVARSGRARQRTGGDLLQEARNAARIQHPNIVQVLEVGSVNDAMYIASELIDGISLARWLKSHRPSPTGSARIVAAVCRATQAAHAAGVIHRDLKPGNILMDTQGNPHVTDFGLAVRSRAPEVLVQMNGTILGTPSYMAPEQARGDIDRIGVRTDVYALGVVLYEMLTGRRPFVASDSKSVLYRIQTEDPVRPRSLDPAIPSDLERICLRAIQKNPDDRYASAAEMGDDLENFLNGFPIKARADWPMHRLTKWITRNRALTMAGVVVVLLGGISAAMYLQEPSDSPDTVPVAIQTDPPATQMEFEPYDEFLRVPTGAPVRIQSEMPPGEVIRLRPGLYRVRAEASGGRTHEVWRFVPKPGEAKSLDQFYPHKAWTSDADGVVKLQGFRLFTDDEVSIAMEAVGGGEFTLGTEDPSGFSEAHRHPVDDLLVGINEVTEAEFERVLHDARLPGGNGTYLDMVDSVFGNEWRSHPDRPVTGYPRDVAILFCELAGGRLPNHAEWEYVATRNGADMYSTGPEPPPIPLASWDITPVTADTPDLRMPSGLRGLCSNAAELTDSVCVSYRLLYPDHIARPIDARPDPDKLAILSQAHEVRGGDQQWIDGQPAQEAPSARTRAVSYVVDGTDADSHTTRARIGWRMFRTRHRNYDRVEPADSK